MIKYEIVARSGKRRESVNLLGVKFFVKANNYYHIFGSHEGDKPDYVKILKDKSVDIPLGNWFFVEEFQQRDIIDYPEFIEAIDDYFNQKGDLFNKQEYI